VSIRMIAASSL